MFIGTVENRIDQKGRVSVPAAFRSALSAPPAPGFVAFPSVRPDWAAIECCTPAYMQRISASVGELDLFSDEQDGLASLIFATAHNLAFDSEGRIVLPSVLREHAGIADRVAFVGRGETFQIWEPGKLRAHQVAAVERARRDRLSLRLRPAGSPA